MAIDIPTPTHWQGVLPDGTLVRLPVAPGVHLCRGDHLRIGRALYEVVARARSSADAGWIVTLRAVDTAAGHAGAAPRRPAY